MIPSIIIPDCSATPQFKIPNHNEKCRTEAGKVAFIALPKRDHTFTDITDETEWQTAVTAGDVIVCETSGEVPRPTANFGTGKGEMAQVFLNHSWTFEAMVYAPKVNYEALRNLNNNSGEYGVIFITSDFTGWVALSRAKKYCRITYASDIAIPAAQTEEVTGNIVGSWTERELLYPTPVAENFFRDLPRHIVS